MVSTRRSRSAGGESEGGVTAHASQEEVSSIKGAAAASNIKHGAAAPALDPIIEEGVPGNQSQQAPQTSQRRRRVQQPQQSQEEKEVLQQQDTQQQPQDTQQHPFQEQAKQQRSKADVLSSDDAESDLDFDGPDVLQNLAAAIQSGFRSQSQQPPQQQRFQGLRAAAAAHKQQELDDAQLQQLRWRPHTGLQLPAKAAAAVSLVRPRQSKKSQQQDEPLGALVDTAAEAQAAAQQPADEAAAAAAATKQPGLSKALHAPTLDAAARTKEAKKTAPDTAGSKWFDLPAPKVTDELKRDLRLLRLRGAYDPKRFYKSFDNSKFPKYFAVGTVVDDPLDNNRLSKGQRRATLTEQLLVDTELTTTRKKRFNRLQEESQKWVKHKKRKTTQLRKKPAKHKPKH